MVAPSVRPKTPPADDKPAPPSDTGTSCLLRILWFILGPAFALIAAGQIFEAPSRGFSVADMVFWLLLGACIGVRYIDDRKYGHRRVDGTPATARDFRRYALAALAVGAAIWFAAHRAFLG